jgi:hypothetical protein
MSQLERVSYVLLVAVAALADGGLYIASAFGQADAHAEPIVVDKMPDGTATGR